MLSDRLGPRCHGWSSPKASPRDSAGGVAESPWEEVQAKLDSMDGGAERWVLWVEEGLMQRPWGELRSALRKQVRGARPTGAPPSGPPWVQGHLDFVTRTTGNPQGLKEVGRGDF